MFDFFRELDYLVLICIVGILLFGSLFFIGVKILKRTNVLGNVLIFIGGITTVLLLALFAWRLFMEVFW